MQQKKILLSINNNNQLFNLFNKDDNKQILNNNKSSDFIKESFYKEYSTNLDELKSNNKIMFRYFCYKYIPFIRNINLPPVFLNLNKEAVLIEYRIMPHLEFLIRNTINKLGSEWSQTVICGTINYEYMKEMCNKIDTNIKIIKTNYDNLVPSLYSLFLSTLDFWNLLVGDKILIYQEDSCIFKSNINDFLIYDYIGAPWSIKQNDTPNGVGNGGFSLRTKKCMIDVINKIPINLVKPNSSTKEYMLKTNSYIIPEDVYFSKTLQDYNLGLVADRNTASKFSSESFFNPECLGGHNFWLNYSKWKIPLYKNIIKQLKINSIPNESHRGGWTSVLNSLNNAYIFNEDSDTFFLGMIEKYFMWQNNKIIINKPWCGIIHCTPNTPQHLNAGNIKNLITNTVFLKSLNTCKFIITLSDYIKNYIGDTLKKLSIHIPIIFIKHPIKNENFPLFNIDSYINNKNKKIIQIGQQLRKITSIFKININNHQKLWLTGISNLKLAEEKLRKEYEIENSGEPFSKDYRKYMDYITNHSEYDNLLSNNIVFIDLYDSAANNTVLECIIRNTPIILNKTPGVIEYLGIDYPLYFDNLDEVNDLCNMGKIKKATEYLQNMNKEDISMEYFVRMFTNVLNKYL